MSYIRAGSNPEGLYVFSASSDKNGHVYANILPGYRCKRKSLPDGEPMLVPQAVFDRVAVLWNDVADEEVGVSYKVRLEHVFTDEGDPPKFSVVPPKDLRFGQKTDLETEFLVRVSYKGEWVLLWQVTWEHVARSALNTQRAMGSLSPRRASRKVTP